MDDSCSLAYLALSQLYWLAKQYQKSIEAGEKAVDLSPNSAPELAVFGHAMLIGGVRYEEAVEVLEKATRLSPMTAWISLFLGYGYNRTGRYDEAVEACKRALDLNPNLPYSYSCLAFSYMKLGRKEEARSTITELVKRRPNFFDGLERWETGDQAYKEDRISTLREAAGLK